MCIRDSQKGETVEIDPIACCGDHMIRCDLRGVTFTANRQFKPAGALGSGDDMMRRQKRDLAHDPVSQPPGAGGSM